MLLALRSLWEAITAETDHTSGATHQNKKIQRKLRRLARWSDNVVAPPRVGIIIEGEAFPPLDPSIALGEVISTKNIAVYSKGIFQAGISVAPFLGTDVSISASSFPVKSEMIPGEIETKIDLLEDEMIALALMAA
jgi:hypothetical protein